MNLISIIVPVYNSERWLHRCIDSILNQTFIDFELLLIDDGSTDRSGAICDAYALEDSRIRVFHKINGGASSARNVGLVNACGEWITFCDADDYVYPDWLANFKLQEGKQYDLLTQGLKTDKHFSGINNQTYSGFDYIGDPIGYLNKACEYHIVGYNVIKAFRKNLIIENGLKFNENLWFREDEVFLLHYISHCKKIRSLKEAGYLYFTPDWDVKYKASCKDWIYLEEQTLEALSKFNPSAYNTQIAINCRNSLSKNLTQAFYETKNLKYVEKLQMYYREHPDFAHLFRLTRSLIQIDSSCIISGIFLYIHMSIRNSFNIRAK